MSNNKYITAFAPASIGNVAVGFDMLGLAIDGVGDRVSVRKTEAHGVMIKEIYDHNGQPHQNLSREAEKNTASIAANSFWESHGIGCGVELIIHKGIPLQSGMGSSAASAVAGVVAVNALLKKPLDKSKLLSFALKGEKYASGEVHADNVAPSLIGGLVFCPQSMLPETLSIKVSENLSSVLIHPDLFVNTAESRLSLKANYSLSEMLQQQSYLAGFLLGIKENNFSLIRDNLKDIIVEPQRSSAVPCFDRVKETAINNGAFGCSLSGSGPSIFAICESKDAQHIESVMIETCKNEGYDCQSWVSNLNSPGAYVESN
ncbi:MAG: homoserine kinase [Pseudomonadota bacterium]|nr:homoserine kinase [Pseudomonadota bacterium]